MAPPHQGEGKNVQVKVINHHYPLSLYLPISPSRLLRGFMSHQSHHRLGYPQPTLLLRSPERLTPQAAEVCAPVLTAGLPVGAEDEVQASVESVHLSDSSKFALTLAHLFIFVFFWCCPFSFPVSLPILFFLLSPAETASKHETSKRAGRKTTTRRQNSSVGRVCGIAATPLQRHLVGGSHSHGPRGGGGDGRDADFRVDVEDGRRAAAARKGLDADARNHVVVVLVRGQNVLLEDDLLGAVARKGVAGAASARLALRKTRIAGEAGLNDGEPICH